MMRLKITGGTYEVKMKKDLFNEELIKTKVKGRERMAKERMHG